MKRKIKVIFLQLNLKIWRSPNYERIIKRIYFPNERITNKNVVWFSIIPKISVKSFYSSYTLKII